MADYMLKYGEKARTVQTIIWVEDLERRYGDHWQRFFYGYMADLGCMVACSPVHDRDTYTDTDVRNWQRRHQDPDTGEVATEYTNQEPRVGDPKKPHIHVIIIVKGPMTREDFSGLLIDLVWVHPCKWQRVIHLDVVTRYLAHMDNKEKAQYSVFDVVGFGNFNLKPLTIAKSDEYTKAMSMAACFDYIEENDLKYYHQLAKWAKSLGDYDIYACVTGRYGTFVSYFSSLRIERMDKAERKRRKGERDKEAENIT